MAGDGGKLELGGKGHKVTGTIWSIGATEEIGARGFRKRTFVLTWKEKGRDKDYEQHVECQVTGRNCEGLDRWAEGDLVTATYDLRGRKRANGDGCFNSIEVWRIEAAGDGASDRARDCDDRRDPPPHQERRDDRRNDPPPTHNFDPDLPF